MKNALVVIDIQNDYFPGGAFPLEGAEQACQEAVLAIRRAQADGWLVIGIQHVATPDAPFFRPDSHGAELHAPVAAALGHATVLRKNEADSFYGTGLEEILHSAGITDLWLTGMMTQHCVTHTALSPQVRGMTVHVLSRGCAAPSRALSELALSGLKVRCKVE
ncbi:isochorismatase family protein [Franconibacter pulveris]|uniref:isochorismatase family protein n=1 Tax=Franconibacter pulveris TaxID=435910 RepID=UPI0004965DF9|nr:isochorismatase family protein [Franconibacter pulveris]